MLSPLPLLVILSVKYKKGNQYVYRASEQNLYNSYVIASRVLSNVLRLNSGCSVTLPTISFHSSLYVDWLISFLQMQPVQPKFWQNSAFISMAFSCYATWLTYDLPQPFLANVHLSWEKKPKHLTKNLKKRWIFNRISDASLMVVLYNFWTN